MYRFIPSKKGLPHKLTIFITVASFLLLSAHTRAPKQPVETNRHRGILSETPEKSNAEVIGSFGKLPMRFETNAGQVDANVGFLSRGGDYTLLVMPAELAFSFANGRASQSKRARSFRMKLVGADERAQGEGIDRLPTTSNYFVGNDPK